MKKTQHIFTAVLAAAVLMGGCSQIYGNSQFQSSDVSSYPESIQSEESPVSFPVSSDTDAPSDSSASQSSEGFSESKADNPYSDPAASGQESLEIAVSSSQASEQISPPKQESTAPEVSEPPDTSKIKYYDSKYFVKELDEKQLRNFICIYDAAASFKKSAEFDEPITDDELSTLMFLLNYDCPELIHLSGDYYPEYNSNDMYYVCGVSFSYCLDQLEYDSAMKKLNEFFDGLRSTLNGKNELAKEKYVYDYIFQNCIYNEADLLSGSVYGTLINHKGRCEGFSKSFMWCMRELGIECLTVSGTQNWDYTALYPNHSWNIVKINGDYYHLDVTVDNVQLNEEKGNPANYGFFNVNDEMIADNREISSVYTDLGVPACDSLAENYHIINDLYLYHDEFYRMNLFAVLSDHFDDEGIHPVSIKFYTRAEYEAALYTIDDDVKEFLNDNSDNVFTFNTYYNDLSYTIIIEAADSNSEGE
ncbi:MAG: hypothetical protein IJ861_07485 [Clostridia bacterium]|nr:hypothetical protein [Clostridia bacterium]